MVIFRNKTKKETEDAMFLYHLIVNLAVACKSLLPSYLLCLSTIFCAIAVTMSDVFLLNLSKVSIQ